MAFTSITLTGAYSDQGGDPAAGFIQIELTATLQQPGGPIVAPVIVSLKLEDDGTFSVPLEATDDPLTTPSTAAYRIIELIEGTVLPNIYFIVLPHNAPGRTINISDCPRVAPAMPPTDNFVTVAGLDAAVAAAIADLGAIEDLTSEDATVVITGSGDTRDLSVPGGGHGSGTVTSVSFAASANGFTGTVDNDTTTPSLTIETTVGGILKGNGSGGVTDAIPGTDFDAAGAAATAQANAEAASDAVGSAATAQANAEIFATGAVATETTRAEGAESTLSTAISTETTRAEGVEATKASTTALNAEVARAEAAEATLATSTALAAETTRAEAAEGLAAQKSANLGDLGSAGSARTNLGLGTASLHNTADFDAAGAAAAAQAAAIAASDPSGSATTAQANAESFATAAVGTETTRAEAAEVLLLPLAGGTITGALAVNGDMTLPAGTFSTTTGKFVGGAIREAIGLIVNNTFTMTVGPVSGLTAAPASVGINVTSLTSLVVTSASNPPPVGQLSIPTSGGGAVINYTSYNSGTLTFGGVTLVSGSGTVSNTAFGVSTSTAGTDPLLGVGILVQYNPTINYSSGPLGSVITSPAVDGPRGLVEVEGTYTYHDSESGLLGIGPVFQNEMVYRNAPSSAVNICVGEGFVNVPQAIGDTVAANFVPINSGFNVPGQGQNWTIGFTDIPIFATVNGGTLGATNPGQAVSFFSWAAFGAGTTTSQRIGLLVHDASVGGTLTNQLGIVIGNLQLDGVSILPLVGGTNNVGISTASPIQIGASTATFTALPYPVGLNIFPNTYTYNYTHSAIPTGFAIGGTHITTTSGVNGFATQFVGAAVSSAIKNSPTGTTPNFGPVVGIIYNGSITADTLTLTGGNLVGFNASPSIAIANAGSLTQSSILGFQFGPTVGSGTTASLVAGLSIADAGGTGTATVQAGVDMPILIRGGTNIGFRYGSGGQTLTATPGGAPISLFAGTTTLNFANAVMPTAILLGGTYSFTQGGSGFGSNIGFSFGPTLVNTSTSANGISLGATFGVVVSPILSANTKTGIATGAVTGFLFGPTTSVSNSGTITSGSLTGFTLQGTIGAGTTVTSYTGISAVAPTITGTLTSWTGISIAAVTGAGTNAGIINASPYVATPSGSQAVSAAFTVTANAETVQLTSSGAVSATTAAAVIAVPGNNGQRLTIINANTTTANTMTFTSGATEKLSLGATTRAVGAGGSLTLTYNSTFGRWVETGFNAGGN